MHRSGTSLFANYLMNSGLHVGSELLKADDGNPKGYYEDIEILQLHDEILKFNNIGYMLNLRKLPEISFARKHVLKAKKIVEKRISEHQLWGWKDPRTCLFLDFWNEVIDVPKRFVFLFREPSLVYDSLRRRASDPVINEYPISALKSWFIYNLEIVKFHKKINNQYNILINISDFISDISFYDEHVKKITGLQLDNHKQIIDPDAIKKKSSLCYKLRLAKSYPAIYLKSFLLYKYMCVIKKGKK